MDKEEGDMLCLKWSSHQAAGHHVPGPGVGHPGTGIQGTDISCPGGSHKRLILSRHCCVRNRHTATPRQEGRHFLGGEASGSTLSENCPRNWVCLTR